MIRIGQPKQAPNWYRTRVHKTSYIEDKFAQNVERLALAIEAEQWFGDKEKHARYRVDFILRDARLIIELDGHSFHSTPEQLERDAKRRRYLSRAGYAVLNFTGREINRNVQECVDEVRQLYTERMQRSPVRYRVMYVDYRFWLLEAAKAVGFFEEIHPGRQLALPALEEFLPHAIEWLHEKSFVTVFVFHDEEDAVDLEYLNGLTREHKSGEMRINLICDPLYSVALGEHMIDYCDFYDDFLLIGDDVVYIDPLLSVLPDARPHPTHSFSYIPNAKLLRKGDHETSFVGSELVKVHWQDITYAVGGSLGLNRYEM